MENTQLLTKVCTICGLELSMDSFGKRGTRKRDGGIKRASACYKCHYRKYVQPSVQKKTHLVREYKLSKGCLDCGYKDHPEALQFDHINGDKVFTIGSMVANFSLPALMEEISKCEVVCANCHAVRTSSRRKLVTV